MNRPKRTTAKQHRSVRVAAAPAHAARSGALEAGQRVGPLVTLPDLLRQFDVDAVDVLAACHLPADALASPDQHIPFAALGALLAMSATFSHCEHFALLLGSQHGLETLGPVGELSRHAPTVGDALRSFVVHHHLNSRGGVVFLTVDGSTATLGYTIYDASTFGAEYVHDGIAAMMLRVLRDLTEPGWRPHEVLLARRQPAGLAAYRRFFPARVSFDAEFTGLRFERAALARPVPGADATTFRVAERQVAAAGRRSLVNDLKRVLRVEMLRGATSASHVAQILMLHQRTLNRRLSDCGTTFQQLLDEVRYDSARHLLHLTQIPMAQIAASLGYAEAASFTRAFRRWSGTTPALFRAQHGPKVPGG